MRLQRALLDALFPSSCAGCRTPGGALCAACLPCGTRVIVRGGLPVLALGPYEGAWRRSVLAFKHGRRDVGAALAALAAERFRTFVCARASTLAGVPTTRARARERGFDQGVWLASEIARLADFAHAELLEQVAGDAQRGRNRVARLAGHARFAVRREARTFAARIVLVDDVVTTGATLADCAAALCARGATVTGAVALAYA